MTPNASYTETDKKKGTRKEDISERYEVIENLRPYHVDIFLLSVGRTSRGCADLHSNNGHPELHFAELSRTDVAPLFEE